MGRKPSAIAAVPETQERFVQRVGDGANERELMAEFGVSLSTVQKYKQKFGLDKHSGKYGRGQGRRKYYTIWLRETDDPVCFGTSQECAKALGISMNAFYRMVYEIVHGKPKKYEILVEDYDEVMRE